MSMTGFLCKTDDTEIYDAMRVSDALYDVAKAAWVAVEGQVIIEQEFTAGSWDYYCIIDEVACIDEPKYITEGKAKLIRALTDYRWDMFNTKIYVGATLIDVDLNGRTELNFNCNSFSAMPIEDRPATVPFKELNDAGWMDVDPTSAIAWQIMISLSDSFESRTAQKAVEVLINALDTCWGVDTFQVDVQLDNILKPILAADLIKYAYPTKYHNEDA